MSSTHQGESHFSHTQEDLFLSLADHMLDGVIIIGWDGTVIFANRAAIQLMELNSASEAIGLNMLEFIHPDSRKSVIEDLNLIREGKRGFKADYRIYQLITRRGKPKWVETIGTQVTFREQTADLVTLRDITARKVAEEALKDREELLRSLMDHAPIGLCTIDTAGDILYVNHRFEELSGYSRHELLGRNGLQLDMFDPETLKRFKDRLKNRLQGGDASPIEARLTRRDGRIRWLEISARAIIESKVLVGFQIVCQNITKRKKAEAALCMSEKKFRELAEMLPEPIYEFGEEGTFNYANRRAFESLGYCPADIEAGMHWHDVIVPEDHRRVAENITRLSEGGDPHAIEYTVLRKDGTTFPAILRSAAIFDHGIPVGLRGFITDISEQKKAEAERAKLEAQLQRARKMEALGTLAGGVAHDLNNVLGGIVSYPELLLMQLPEDSPLKTPLMTIHQSGIKAAAIVNDLLTLARRGVARPEVLNLNELIVEQCRTPEHEKLLHFHQNMAVELCLDENLLNVSGSPVHLSKTIMNLISNAAEAMEDGGTIVVSTTNQYIDAPLHGYDDVREGDYVTLSVSDTGIGISPEDMDRIFEPFYTKKVMGRSGTGLGMAVVWGTVKDHDGYIDIRSTEGQGTTITLYFPATREEKKLTSAPAALEEYMGHGETILIVDDVAEQRLVGSTLLQKLGYRVTTVSSGEEAQEYLKKHTADLVILDMIMDPGIDGLETYKRICDINRNQKAIITSGFSESGRVKEAQDLGVGAYIKKPYLMEQLGRAVRTELDMERNVSVPGQ